MKVRISYIIVACLWSIFSLGQSKVNVTITNPTDIHLCTNSDFLTIEVRNISASTVSGIETKVELSTGITYISGSLSSTNVTEKNISNLSEPVFSIPNLGITQSATFKIKLNTSCGLSAFLNNGGLALAKTTTLFSGGSVSQNSSAFNIKQPSLQIQGITNQLKTADLGDVFERKITVKNSGAGKLGTFSLIREYRNGQRLIATNGGTITTAGNKTTSLLDSTDFKTIGNSDIFLDFGESFVFTDSIRVVACTNLSVKYILEWGCNGTICVSRRSAANTTISSKVAQLVFSRTSSTSSCLSDQYEHNQEVVIFNSGNDTARSMDFNVFQNAGSGYYAYAISQILTNTFTYKISGSSTWLSASPYKTTATSNTGRFACLGSNPKGEAYLKLPNMAPNDSITIRWKTKSCCPTVCNSNSTLYNQRWRFKTSFQDQCGNVVYSGDQIGSYGSFQSMIISKFIPTDISEGETKQWEYSFSNGYLFSPSVRTRLVIELILPATLSHTMTSADLKFAHHNGSSWSPSRFTQSGDTVRAFFYGPPSVTLPRSELLINLEASCNSATSNSTSTYKMNMSYNPDTTCNSGCDIPVYCDSDDIRIHCSSGCNTGLGFSSYDAKRITYGLPDNNNDGIADTSGSLNFSSIKRHRIMYGDTVLTTFRAKVNNAGSITTWEHGKAISKLNYGRYLSVASAQLSVYRSGNLVVTCPDVQYTFTASGNAKTFSFNFGINSLVSSGCSIYYYYKYSSQDSLVLDVKYIVDKNIGNNNVTLRIDNEVYTSTVASPSTSQKYSCDSFSANLSLMGYYFANYGPNVLTIDGCSNVQTSQNFYLSIGRCCSNYAGGNIFPYEYRKWAKLKEIIVLKEPGFDILSASLRQYRTKGTGANASQYISSILPYSTSNREYKYRVDSLYEDLGGVLKISDDGFTGTFSVLQKPNCKAIDGISQVMYGFVFEKLGNWASGLDTIFSTTNSDAIRYIKPSVGITITNDYVYPEKDTVVWEARISNTRSGSAANNIWLGAYDKPNSRIVAVQDKLTGNYFTKTNDIFELGNLASSGYKDVLIYAKYISCDKDSIALMTSSDCGGYPDSISVSTCNRIVRQLYYEPINSRLEANILGSIDAIDLCDEQEITIQIRNTGTPDVYGSYLDIILRPGMVLRDSAWLFVDGRSDSIRVDTFTNSGPNTYRWTFANHDTLFRNSGLRGVNSSTGHFMNLRFKLSTDCDFTSATGFLLKPGGFLKCGKAVNAPYTVGDVINIKGVVKPYFSAIDFHIEPLDVCNYKDSTFAKFINLGPDTTRTSDRFTLSLPNGIFVDTNFVDTQINSPVGKPTYAMVNGENTYSWILPEGIVPGDSSLFKIKTYLNNNLLSCGTKQMYAQAVVSQPALCVATNTYCDINVATSSLLTTDSVVKGEYQLDFINATSLPNGANEEISLNYKISNSGTSKATGNLLICDIYYDANGNGIIESSDTILYRDSIFLAIGTDSSLQRALSFSTSSAFTCNLMLYISDSNCACGSTSKDIATIQLLNAGKDTLICHNEEIIIGSVGNIQNQYEWNNSSLLVQYDTSTTTLTGNNTTPLAKRIEMILTTTKSSCSSNDTMYVNMHPGMVVNLADSIAICLGESAIIGEPVTGGTGRVKKYSWSPSDSLQTTDKVRTFANPTQNTTYSVVITDDVGCQIFDSTHIRVVPKPTAQITMDDSCANTLFRIKNNSDYLGSAKDSTHWDFQDLGESILNDPLLIIDSSRILPVHLYVSNEFGCWDTTTDYLEIFPIPEASFTYTPACEEKLAELVTISTLAYGTLSHLWTIEGNTYTTDTVAYRLPTQDSLTIALTASSDQGCTHQRTTKVSILDKPDIALTAQSGCIQDSTALSPTLLPGTKSYISSYEWRLGDGNIRTDSAFNYSYADTGTYTIWLQASNADGCVDTAEHTASIYPLPVSGFTVQNACLGDSIFAISTSSISKGSIATILWGQGNGYTAGSDTLKELPNSIGLKTIKQKVISYYGCVDSSTYDYTIYYKERSLFTQQGNCENETITFTATPNQKDSVAQTTWIVQTDTFRQENFSYDFTSDGLYTLSQQTVTNRGCVTDSTFNILIHPAPIATINTDLPCDDNQTSLSGADNYTRYNWDLEDGTTNNTKAFSHTFSTKGTYTIDLEVENEWGCIDANTDSVTIDYIVTPAFEIKDICEGDGQWVVHTTSGQGTPISSASFDMDNGDVIDELDSFLYTYYQDQTYNVTLQITTLPGCDYDTSKRVTIHPLPVAGFKLFPETADIFTAEIEGTDLSVYGDSIVYFFSDGNQSISKNFAHKFIDSGHYEIKQWVSSQFGCLDSITKKLYISFAYNLFIPDAFTPTEDGLNEGFRPVGLGMVRYEMSIYNRWGEKVFESETDQPQWDGKDALPGYYLYHIRAFDFRNNVHSYSGAVYLIR